MSDLPSPINDGFLLVDKPIGPTSHDVVAHVRRAADRRKVGHSGTLDPLADGLMLLGVGRATRLLEYLIGLPKTYEARITLGQETTTYDAEGDIVAEQPVDLDEATVAAALAPFRGPQLQVPPMYAAIKQDGEPLYKRARRGETVERPPRAVEIYELTLLTWQIPDLTVRVRCSAGTYIRSLAHDLGAALACGAHLSALRRTAIGQFDVADAWPLAELTAVTIANAIRPPDEALTHLPALHLDADAARRLQLGQRLARLPDQPDVPLTRVYDADGRFIGIATGSDGRWQPRKIIAN